MTVHADLSSHLIFLPSTPSPELKSSVGKSEMQQLVDGEKGCVPSAPLEFRGLIFYLKKRKSVAFFLRLPHFTELG